MKNHLWLFFLFLFLIAVCTISADSFQTPVNSSHETPLLFLGNENLAPVVYLEGTTPKGVDVDIVRALSPHLSQPVEIIAMNWSEAQALVARGEADALIQINPTEERLKIFDFSDPLLESRFSIFTRSETIGISGLADLRGLRVGVEPRGLPIQIVEKDPGIQVIIIPDFAEGFTRLQKGSLDAVVVDYRVGSYILAKNNIRDIRVSGEPVAFSNSSFAVKKGNIKLLNEINRALKIIKDDGSYQDILDNWKPTEGIFQTREQITEGYHQIAIFILLFFFLIAVIWIVTIRRELSRRNTAEKKLMEQYSTLHGIINSTNALIFSIDSRYRYTSFNRGHAAAMKALYGADIDNGHSILDYITIPEDRNSTRYNLDQALAGKEFVEDVYSGEEVLSRQYFLVSYTPLRNGEEIIGVAVLAHDITERKRAEETLHQVFENLEQEVRERTAQLSEVNRTLINEIAERRQGEQELRESEERYHAIYDQSPIAIELYDATGTLVHVNPACLKLFGTDNFGVIRNFSLFTDFNLNDEQKGNLLGGETIQYQGPFDFEKGKIQDRYPTSRDGTIWMDLLITPLGNDPTMISGFLVQIQDITKRKRAEEAIRTAEETYRNIFLNSQIGLFRTDVITGLLLDANDAVARFFGYQDRTSLLAGPFNIAERYVDPGDRDKVVSLLQGEGEFQNYEMRIRKNDDSTAWLRFSAKLIREKGWIEGVAEDITEYKQAVEALADSETRLQLALSGSETGMWELNIPSMTGSIDNQAAQILGYKPEDIGPHSTDWDSLSHPEDIPLIRHRLGDYLAGRTTIFESEHRMRNASGEWIWVAGKGKITQRLPDGSPLRISGTLQDYTERKRMEEGLKESEKRYRDMFEINNAVMLIIDSETTRITDANAAAVRYYGYTREELTGMLISGINTADPDTIRKNISTAVGQKGTIFQFKHRKKSGEIRDVEVFSGPIIVKGKQLLHSIVQDVTERKRVEEALRQANHKLNLLSSITRHDIGNELQIIFGSLDLAKDADLSPEKNRYIEKAIVSSQNIKRQIAFTSDYENIGIHTPVWQDMRTVITDAVQPVDTGPIRVHIDISGIEVFADPLMEKVFYNLVDNAKRYGENITRIRFSGQEGKEGYTITCEDDGVGIPAEFKEKIFNREYYRHTGFGLNLSREILDITGITIRETGTPGNGARFEIVVPPGKYRVHGNGKTDDC